MWIKEYIDKRAYNLQRYKAGKPIEEIKREIFGDKDVKILKLASNENLAGVNRKILKKLKKDLENVHYYPDDSMYYLIDSLSKFYGIDSQHISVGNGAVELIRYIYQVLIKEGDVIFTPHPTFAIYYIDSNLFGAKHLTYDLSSPNYDIKASDMIEKIELLHQKGIKVKLAVICSPNNPTGSIITNSDLLEFLDYTLKNRIVVILDEAYFEFVDHYDYHDGVKLVKEYENLIVLRTFSKVFSLAGLRIGVAFSNPYIIKAINNVRLPFNVNYLAQRAVIYSLQNYKSLLKSIKRVVKEKYYIYQRLNEMGIEFIPTFANFIAIKVEDHIKVYNDLLLKGIIVRPASDMNMGSYIRVTISPYRDDNNLFLDALKEVMCARSSSG
ncbi:MAG: histidinol-phosphate transaminase [Candidatus Calescibacterium sp.]|nr:histidinol-phosphate transaminase [Candidatus Calescibacterium sp.]MDW8132870.1 histidinol-phosphate transaminase [Candidatus Calescibacterium sp.]